MLSRILFMGYQSILSTWGFQKLGIAPQLEISTGRMLVSSRLAPTRLCSIAHSLRHVLPFGIPCFLWFGLSSPQYCYRGVNPSTSLELSYFTSKLFKKGSICCRKNLKHFSSSFWINSFSSWSTVFKHYLFNFRYIYFNWLSWFYGIKFNCWHKVLSCHLPWFNF